MILGHLKHKLPVVFLKDVFLSLVSSSYAKMIYQIVYKAGTAQLFADTVSGIAIEEVELVMNSVILTV